MFSTLRAFLMPTEDREVILSRNMFTRKGRLYQEKGKTFLPFFYRFTGTKYLSLTDTLTQSRTGQPSKFLGRSKMNVEIEIKFSPLKSGACGRTLVSQWGLDAHIKTVHGRKGFKCEFCHKAFGRRDHLVNHTNSIHTGADFDSTIAYLLYCERGYKTCTTVLLALYVSR